jgi:hypothetical protein
MSSKTEFKVGDIVHIGNNGEKGKIIDIVKPLSTYCMHKVHTFYSGEIKVAAKHELLKGVPDEHFQNLFNSTVFNQKILIKYFCKNVFLQITQLIIHKKCPTCL